MAKKEISADEWYPVYTIGEPSKYEEDNYDVPDDLVERYNKMKEEFEDVQHELRSLRRNKV